MFKTFLVEDEVFVLQSLKAIIDWEKFGFRIIGEALNGVDAYEKIMKLKPDIVFTDIVMPRMNGLELIQKIREENPEVLFVVLSGYAEFAYAQKVFNYGGIGYCLKPFDENEIIAVLKKAKERLEKEKKIVELSLMEMIIEQEKDEGKLEEALNTLGFECHKGKGYVILISIGPELLNFPEHIQSLSLKQSLNKYAYILDCDCKEAIVAYLKENLPPSVKGVGISDVFYSVGLFGEKIAETTLAAYKFFMTGQPGIYDNTEFRHDEMNLIFQSIDEAIEKKELPAIKKSLDKAEEYFSKGLCSVKNVLRFYNTIISFLYKIEEHGADEYSYYYEELFKSFENLHAMLDYLKKILERDFGMKAGMMKEESKNETFMKVLKYINEHYFLDISLQDIARNYIINPSYISQLFKKELNTTYTDYITNLRVKYAENLLRSTNLQITEISEKAGYDDYFYFAKVFKKVTGKTPTEYKQAYKSS